MCVYWSTVYFSYNIFIWFCYQGNGGIIMWVVGLPMVLSKGLISVTIDLISCFISSASICFVSLLKFLSVLVLFYTRSFCILIIVIWKSLSYSPDMFLSKSVSVDCFICLFTMGLFVCLPFFGVSLFLTECWILHTLEKKTLRWLIFMCRNEQAIHGEIMQIQWAVELSLVLFLQYSTSFIFYSSKVLPLHD